jgi:hypothetical protein
MRYYCSCINEIIMDINQYLEQVQVIIDDLHSTQSKTSQFFFNACGTSISKNSLFTSEHYTSETT